jgi:hypothetical protein
MENAKPRVVHRCAITGRWVTKAHADENPDTTVRHVIQPKPETTCD